MVSTLRNRNLDVYPVVIQLYFCRIIVCNVSRTICLPLLVVKHSHVVDCVQNVDVLLKYFKVEVAELGQMADYRVA